MTHIDYSFEIIFVDCAYNEGHNLVGKHYFWPAHLQEYGVVYCILFSYNRPIHKGLYKHEFCRTNRIPEKIFIRFLLKNFTYRFQPMGMGIISCFMDGYSVRIIGTIINIFNIEER